METESTRKISRATIRHDPYLKDIRTRQKALKNSARNINGGQYFTTNVKRALDEQDQPIGRCQNFNKQNTAKPRSKDRKLSPWFNLNANDAAAD